METLPKDLCLGEMGAGGEGRFLAENIGESCITRYDSIENSVIKLFFPVNCYVFFYGFFLFSF